MKRATIILMLFIGLASCAVDEPLDDVFIPGDQPSLSPPAWIQGTWYDDSNTLAIRFRTDNIVITKSDEVLNFEKDLPYVHEDFNTKELYQLSLVVNGQQQQYIFEQSVPNTVSYWHKIMGYGPEIVLSKR